MEWQSVIATGIVVLTLVIFLVRLACPRPKSGCGHGCDCGKKSGKPVE